MEDEHLAAALDRRQRGEVDDLDGLVLGDGRADPLDLVHVGVLAGQRQAGVAATGVVVAGEEGGGEGPGRLVLGRPGRPDQQVGVHRLGGGAAEVLDGGRLTDDAVPHAGQAGQRRHGADPLADGGADAGGHGVDVAGGVDHGPALRVGGGHRPEPGQHPVVEVVAGRLEPVEVTTVEAPGQRRRPARRGG